MKKFLALCLSLVMVLSMFTVAVSAATINVPATTLVDQSFAGLSQAPANWGVNFSNGTVTYENTHLQYTNGATDDSKYAKVAYGKPFNTDGKEYTFSFNLGHYDGITYVHFGADSTEDAVANYAKSGDVAVNGYTLVAGIGRNSDWSKGYYDLYKDGVLLGSITDPGSSYAYKNLREFKFVVTADGVSISIGSAEPVVFKNAAGETSDFEGYVGFHLANNTGASNSPSKLSNVKLVKAAYAYDINDNTSTGGYMVTGQEYVEDYTGTLYLNKDLRTLGDKEPADIGVTAGSGYTKGSNGLSYSGYPSKTVKFGTVTNAAENVIVEANYSSKPASNETQLKFLGYTLYGGASQTAKGNYVLKKGSETLGSASCGSTANATCFTIKAVLKGTSIEIYEGTTLKLSATDASPSRTGDISVVSNYAGSPVIGYAKVYTEDYADSSYYKSVTRDGFVLDETFSTNTYADLDAVKANGFSTTGYNTLTDKGVERTIDGEASITYNKYKFGGSYTAEVGFTSDTNASKLRFNYVDENNWYEAKVDTANKFTITKSVKGEDDAAATTTVLVSDNHSWNMLGTSASYKVTVKQTEEGLNISVTASGKNDPLSGQSWNPTTLTVTDTDPITEGYLKYATGWVLAGSQSKPNIVKYIKAYSGETMPSWNGEFFVNGSNVAGKGDTIFALESAMLSEKADVIAALYEDGKMTDIKMVDLDTLNKANYVQLFNSSSSDAANVNVKVFVWDSVLGMTPVTTAFSMVK